jgi:hypothetical protein
MKPLGAVLVPTRPIASNPANAKMAANAARTTVFRGRPAGPRRRTRWQAGAVRGSCLLCYVRGPENIIVALAEQIG